MLELVPAAQGLDGSRIDGGWYLDVVAFARSTPWLHGPLLGYADFGLILFALLTLLVWWQSRRADPATLALALWVPVATLLGFAVNDLIKLLVNEPRPCRSIRGVSTLMPCDAPTDWSFPSGHSATAAAAAVALLLANRRVGVLAVLAALLMAFSRVYVGAHYPHDVLVGLFVGTVFGLSGLVVRQRLVVLVTSMRAGRVAAG